MDIDPDPLDNFILRKQVYSVSAEGMSLMFRDVPESVKILARELRDQKGWRFLAIEQDGGWCRYSDRTITIPLWVILGKYQARKDPLGQKIWYISHEMAHAFQWYWFPKSQNTEQPHGPSFMECLKRICPLEYIHHEIDYKPRNAQSAGIRKPMIDI